ncbi:MAG: histidine phosphatase family protein [Bacteroidota bacterium]
MGKLSVIRHAQASLMKADYDQLSDLGHEQATLLGTHLAEMDVHFDKVYLGTLKRHQQTAAHILEAFKAKDKPFAMQKMELLNEHQSPKVAKWMLKRALSDEEAPHLDDLRTKIAKVDASIPKRQYLAIFDYVSYLWAKGEIDATGIGIAHFEKFKNRIHQALYQILEATSKGQHIAIVTSGGPSAVLTGKALGLSNGKIMELNSIIQNAAISEFLFSANRFSLHRFNMVSHLKEDYLQTYV